MILERVVVSEKNGCRAFGYLRQIDPNNSLISEYDKKGKVKEINEEEKIEQTAMKRGKYSTSANGTKKRRSIISEYIFMFVLGAVISFLVFVLITNNPEDAPSNTTISKTSQDYLELQDKYEDLERQFKEYKGDTNSAQTRIKQLESQKASLQKQLKIFDVEDLIAANNNNQAVQVLLSLYNNNFEGTIKERYDKYYASTAVPYLENMLKDANSAYKSKSYQEALGKYKTYRKYCQDEQLAAEVTYNIAECYRQLGRKNQAMQSCNKIIKDYPNSSYVSNANSMLAQLKKE